MKNVRTFEGWKNDRAEMEMRKSGEEIMKKAAEKKSAESTKKCDCKDCDCENCDEENCDCGCCCSDKK